jgi:membrane fusion protein, multidrug efflux system
MFKLAKKETVMSEMPRSESFREATEIAAEAPPAAPASSKRNVIRRAGLVLALLAGTATVAYYGHDYWTNGRYLETTDDAYVKAG